MSEIIKSEYLALNENKEYDVYYHKTSADLVVGLGRMKSTTYIAGAVVYSDTNNTIALLCETAGTTSDGELDVSSTTVGETIADGGVVWKAIPRGVMTGATSTTAGTEGLVPTPPAGSQNKALCGDGTFKILPVEGGGTGATTALQALLNLGGIATINGVSANADGNAILYHLMNSNGVKVAEAIDNALNLYGNDTEGGEVILRGTDTEKNNMHIHIDNLNDVFRIFAENKNTQTVNNVYQLPMNESGYFEIALVKLSDNYIRYSNGMQICLGTITSSQGGVITYPAPFLDVNHKVVLQVHSINSKNYNPGINKNQGGTGFTFYSDFSGDYIAIGRWK